MAKYRRKNYLVNKPLQLAFTGLAIWILLLGVMLAGTVTYFITINTIVDRMTAVDPKFGIAAYELVRQVNSVLGKRIIIMMASLVVLAGILEVLYMHRIAGPIYRIEKTLHLLSEGKPFQPIRLRNKDFFKGLAEAINNVMVYQQKKDEKVKELLQLASRYPELKDKSQELQQLLQ
ncbi:MAG TPA: hypothetical protein PKX93_03450 [bacterium]|nr:hypothetical protein [bacterium]HPP12066.1 hypothetical protein [bacterium]